MTINTTGGIHRLLIKSVREVVERGTCPGVSYLPDAMHMSYAYV